MLSELERKLAEVKSKCVTDIREDFALIASNAANNDQGQEFVQMLFEVLEDMERKREQAIQALAM